MAAEVIDWKEVLFLSNLFCSEKLLHDLHQCLRPSGEFLSSVNSEMGKWRLHFEQYLAMRGV